MTNIFIERLKKLRYQKKVSQAALAGELGFSQQAVGKWETGVATPDPDTLRNIAQYFNVTVDYLLGTSPDDSPSSMAAPPARKGVLIPVLGCTEGDNELTNLLQDETAPTAIQSLSEDEKELLRIFRILSRRLQHEFMVKAYEFESREELEGGNATSDVG